LHDQISLRGAPEEEPVAQFGRLPRRVTTVPVKEDLVPPKVLVVHPLKCPGSCGFGDGTESATTRTTGQHLSGGTTGAAATVRNVTDKEGGR